MAPLAAARARVSQGEPLSVGNLEGHAGARTEQDAFLRAELARSPETFFPDLPRGGRLRLLTPDVQTSHLITVIETSANGMAHRLLAKGVPLHEGVKQSVEVEHRMLRDVCPRLEASSPDVRCPHTVAYYPERNMLVMEWAPGNALGSVLFRRLIFPGALRILRLCGRWLGLLHVTTRGAKRGRPFAAVLEQIRRTTVVEMLEAAAGVEGSRAFLEVAERAALRYHDWEVPLVTAHYDFHPMNILVKSGRATVVDLASARSGFVYRDLGLFMAFFDAAPIWARWLAALKGALKSQLASFVAGYEETAGPLSPLDRCALRLYRVHSVAVWLRRLQASRWPGLARSDRKLRLRLLCAEETAQVEATL